MNDVSEVIDLTQSIVPSAVTIAVVFVVLFIARRVLERAPGNRFRNQVVMLGLTFAGLIVVIVSLPIGDSSRGQVLSLIGILLSAAIALSSTTFLGNAMAGIMLRVIRNFRTGDFIRCGDHFGRVSERGLVHTEIQNEDRELTTLPNLYLVTQPVTTIRKSGTIIATHVGLGYDVPRTQVKALLLDAAREAGLSDPFVQIRKLGDFSVTYRVAGLLTDVKQILSVQSRLRAKVLDALHGGDVEIVSPNFMNQRVLERERRFVPDPSHAEPIVEQEVVPEDLVFDKAEEAESLEALEAHRTKLTLRRDELKTTIKTADKQDDDAALKERLTEDLARLEARIESLGKLIDKRHNEVDE